MVAAVFLDRDGTIIEDRGDIGSSDQIVFFPNTIPALQRLQEHFQLFIVTNQSGISRGNLTTDQVNAVNQFIREELSRNGIHLVDIFVCPHTRQEGCPCIKPNPHFLHIARDQYGVSLPLSYTIGDHPHDVAFAHKVGAKGIYVLTGHGAKHLHEVERADFIAQDIEDAVKYIMAGFF